MEGSTELSAESYQDPKPTQSEHGRYNCLDPEREIIPDGSVEPLVVKEDGEGGEDPEEIQYRRNFFG